MSGGKYVYNQEGGGLQFVPDREEWWKCEVCGHAKVNVTSGSTCPNGCGGITPLYVTEEPKTQKPRPKKPAVQLLPETRHCSWCEAWATHGNERKAACPTHIRNL